MQRNLLILALGFLFFQHCNMLRILRHANRGIFFSFFFFQLWNELRNRSGFFSSRYHLYCQCLVTFMPECSCLEMVFLQYTEELRGSARDFFIVVEITSLCSSPYQRGERRQERVELICESAPSLSAVNRKLHGFS